MKLRVNNETIEVRAAEDTPLLWVLRDQLNRLGFKVGRRHVTTLMKKMGIEALTGILLFCIFIFFSLFSFALFLYFLFSRFSFSLFFLSFLFLLFQPLL